jgi:hypothetical protein
MARKPVVYNVKMSVRKVAAGIAEIDTKKAAPSRGEARSLRENELPYFTNDPAVVPKNGG